MSPQPPTKRSGSRPFAIGVQRSNELVAEGRNIGGGEEGVRAQRRGKNEDDARPGVSFSEWVGRAGQRGGGRDLLSSIFVQFFAFSESTSNSPDFSFLYTASVIAEKHYSNAFAESPSSKSLAPRLKTVSGTVLRSYHLPSPNLSVPTSFKGA